MIPGIPPPNASAKCPECEHEFYFYSTKDVDFWPVCRKCGAKFHVKTKQGTSSVAEQREDVERWKSELNIREN